MKISNILIATIAILLAIAATFLFLNKQTPDPIQDTFHKTSVLEAKTKKRFAELRSLTPCDYEDRQWLAAANRKLSLAGKSPTETLILVAPTFSDIYLLTFGLTSLDRYTFPGQTAFDSKFLENDQVTPKQLQQLKLPQNSYERLIGAIARNTEYAMSSPEYGHDGTVYFFKNGSNCAMAWSPTHGTVGGYLTESTDLLTEARPSIPAFNRALDSLEKLELAY